MDYSYILNTSVPQNEKLKAFGFSAAANESAASDGGEKLVLKKEIADGQFYVLIQLSDASLTADVCSIIGIQLFQVKPGCNLV